MKLYTRNGDDGSTGLFGGQRVPKDDPRVEAYGTVDELNSALGFAAAACAFDELTAIIARLQPALFDLGSHLCSPGGANPHVAPFTEAHIEEFERTIDAVCAPLETMKNFVLPGGTELASRLHLARCVCRRAERLMVGVARTQPVEGVLIIYMNRLSDLLFAMARRANQLAGVPDVPWKPRG